MSNDDMYEWYEKLYIDVSKSPTYSKYCEMVFQKDLSQQGFSDIAQIDLMLSNLGINQDSKVLEIGCGTGKTAEYINSKTKAGVFGIDASPTAIGITEGICNRSLVFQCIDMDHYEAPSESYDAIIAIDSIFFSQDLEKLISKLTKMLKPNGILAIYYIEIIFDSITDIKILLAENTMIGKAFEALGFSYEYFDVTEDTYFQMKLKRKVVIELKDNFIQEGNEYLYEYIFRESIPLEMSLEEFKKRFARYLFLYKKQ